MPVLPGSYSDNSIFGSDNHPIHPTTFPPTISPPMLHSGQHAIEMTKKALTPSDLCVAEEAMRKLGSLAFVNSPTARLEILSCLAAETLKEEFPEPAAREDDVVSNEPSYDADEEDDASLADSPQFKTGEWVRIHADPLNRDQQWRYYTIADLRVFPPRQSQGGWSYPVLVQKKPRVVMYFDSKELGRVYPL